jgi:GNAT superfamily N-acetyltransferase
MVNCFNEFMTISASVWLCAIRDRMPVRKVFGIFRKVRSAQKSYPITRLSLRDGTCLGLPPCYQLAIEDQPDGAALEFLPRVLEAFNECRWPNHQAWQTLGVLVRDTGTIAAGLTSETYAGWLFIKYLWVRDDLRGRGVGRELMAQVERRALDRGCHSAWLDTFSFQARGFYKKLGYEEFGTLDYPPDHRRHFMRKRLVSAQ